jgi:solute carrier family 50 protein (sugar transporter)
MITANLMFSAPYRDVRKAAEAGTLGDLNPTPWAFMLGNCVGWIIYSMLIRNFFVFFANIFAFLLSAWFNMIAMEVRSCL